MTTVSRSVALHGVAESFAEFWREQRHAPEPVTGGSVCSEASRSISQTSG